MTRITSQPAPPPPAATADTSPLFRLHLLVTAVLGLALAAVAVLAAAGVVTFGKPAAEGAKAAATDADGAATTGKGGRYQIEVAEDARAALGLGVSGLDLPVREAFVFHYKGGFLSCRLEDDSGKPPVTTPEVPRDGHWGGLLGDDAELVKGNPEALNKEGHLVLLAMSPSISDIVDPLHPHMGAMLTAGPAGPLHTLVPFYHEVWRRYEYRLILSVRPPKEKVGHGFDYPLRHLLLVRTHLAKDDPRPHEEPFVVTGHKDLEAGKEVTLLERTRGLSTIRLKRRFLTDKEVSEKLKQTEEKKEKKE